MGASDSPFKQLAEPDRPGTLETLISRPHVRSGLPPPPRSAVSTARLNGFDVHESPILSALAGFPGELVPARTTVALRRSMIGTTVLVLHENGDPMRPIVVGVLQDATHAGDCGLLSAAPLDVQADGERLTLTAECEIVLKCGDASITLTRAGKVIIRGNYIVSRSSGYNKIKGAAVDIN